MKTHYVILLVLPMLFSCSTERLSKEDLIRYREIDIASFSSREELTNAINVNEVTTKAEEIVGPKQDLFVDINEVNVETDPILSVEFQRIDDTFLLCEGDNSLYEVLGYNKLIPNKAFAKILNAKAEVMVRDTVYKISPRGTYFFPFSSLKDFEIRYEDYENMDGTLVADNLYQLSDHVFRYSTFDADEHDDNLLFDDKNNGVNSDLNSNNEISSPEVEFDSSVTKAPYLSTWGNQINWMSYPRENISAYTVVGKLLERLFGRSRYYRYNYSNRVRFSARFYYYNYVIYSESGMSANTEHRPFLFWKDINAEKICVGCRNVVYEMKIPASVPSGLPPQNYVCYSQEQIPMVGNYGKVYYIFDRSIKYSELMSMIKGPIQSLYNELRRRTGHDVSEAKAFKFFVDSRVVVVVPSYYLEGTNSSYLVHTFYEQWTMGLSSINIHNMPQGIMSWLSSFLEGSMSVPRFTLKSGEVQAAAQYCGQIKAVTLYKN